MRALPLAAGLSDGKEGKGDRWICSHIDREHLLTIDPRNPLLTAYISNAIRAIEEVLPDAC